MKSIAIFMVFVTACGSYPLVGLAGPPDAGGTCPIVDTSAPDAGSDASARSGESRLWGGDDPESRLWGGE